MSDGYQKQKYLDYTFTYLFHYLHMPCTETQDLHGLIAVESM